MAPNHQEAAKAFDHCLKVSGPSIPRQLSTWAKTLRGNDMNTDPELRCNPEDAQHAIVLSGNGAYAAYEIGIMKALIHGMCSSTHHRPIQPEIYTGTSVGALIAAMMVAGADESDVAALENLERL